MRAFLHRDFKISLSLIFCCTFLIWLVTRFALMAGNVFPLNDGGMFAVMIDDLKNNSFCLPAFTNYNNAEIPFAYPPLAFYLGAFFPGVFGVSAITVLCWMPFFFNLLSVLAFAWFAWTFWEKKSIALFSAMLFVLLPRSGNWLLSGGGLTRGVGFFFSLLAIHWAFRAFHHQKRRDILWSGLFLGLTIASHLESGVFAVLSVLVLSFVQSNAQGAKTISWRTRLGLITQMACIAALVISPWVLTVLLQHGMQPFLSAGQTGGKPPSFGNLLVVPLILTDETLPLLMVLWWIGSVVALRRRLFLLPLWVAAIVLFMWRSYQTQAVIPIALLCGLALDSLLSRLQTTHQKNDSLPAPLLLPAATIVAGLLFGRSLQTQSNAVLQRLDAKHHAAMQWVKNNTPAQTKFIVLSTHRGRWWEDREAEWFPALANRRSVFTVQGTEWLPQNAFKKQSRAVTLLSKSANFSDLKRTLALLGESYDAIYLDAREDAKLKKIQQELEMRQDFSRILEGPVAIYKRTYQKSTNP